jgi:hypothetical protein
VIYKFTEYIKESPDQITLDSGEELSFDNHGARPFGILNPEIIKPEFLEYKNKMIVGNYDSYHPLIIGELLAKKILKTEEFDAWKILKYFKYPGRLWGDQKIISFWRYPKNVEELKNTIKQIEDESNLKIWDNGWKIEIIDYDEDEIDNGEYKKQFSGRLIPIEEYKKSKNPTEEEYQFHLMKTNDPRRKNRFIKGFGSDSKKGRQPLKWKQALLKSENVEYIKESPDKINYNDELFYHFDADALPFGYIKNDLVIGEYSDTHPFLISREIDIFISGDGVSKHMEYAGRLFTGVKIITFWEFPETKEKLEEIILDLEKLSELDIWDNGWKIEVINDIDKAKYDWNNKDFDVKFIPVEDYEGSENFSNELRLQHLKSPLLKQKRFGKGFGSDSKKGRQPLKFKQFLLKSENYSGFIK